jgi:hypothetical protein
MRRLFSSWFWFGKKERIGYFVREKKKKRKKEKKKKRKAKKLRKKKIRSKRTRRGEK